MSAAARILLARTDGLDDARLAHYHEWLSATERARTFVRPARRRQFIAARALLRIGLGTMLQVPPQAVVLGGRPGSAPWLVSPGVPLPGLSVSHSGDWVACALSGDVPLGLDIELRDPARDVDALAEHAFDEATCARLAALPESARRDAFYAAWCGQEARVKLGGAESAVACVEVAHPELAIVLCSSQDLAPPLVEVIGLS